MPSDRSRPPDSAGLPDQEFEPLVEQAPDVIVRVDRDLRLLYANRAAREILGLRQEEVVGAAISELEAPETLRSLWLETNDSVLDSGKEVTIDFEFPGIPVDGEDPAHAGGARWFQSRTVPEVDADGTVTSVLVISRDITDLKRVETELRRRTDELGERVKELRCLYGVSRALQATDRDPRDVLREVVDSIPPGWQYPEITVARLRVEGLELQSDGFTPSPWVLEEELRLDGETVGRLEVVYLEERPERDEGPFLSEERDLIEALGGQIVAALHRKRTEDALARSERTFRALIEQNRDMVAIASADGTVTFVSSAVEEILGFRPVERLGKGLVDCAHPSEVERLEQILARVVREPELTPTVVFRAVRKDGSDVYLESRATNLLDDPAIRGIVVNTRDVTARTLAERQRERLEEQLRHAQKMEAVGRLAGGVAHDFNNLLTVIRGHADLLLGGLDDQDPRHQSATEIDRAAERAADLTRQLLAYGRRQVLRPRILDLNRVVFGLESMLRRLIGEHIELDTVLDDEIQPVLADPGQIEQVILNLVINARDAMETGGRLTIATGRGDEPGRSPLVVLEVSDSGCGMPPEILDQVFEPFFTTKEQGSGLGLATVYGIVQQSGGEITVDSTLGEGTTFRLSFPPADGAPTEEIAATRPTAKRGSATVLLVEDEEAVRTLAAHILERAGYRVITRECGLEALELIEQDPGRAAEELDLLVTDLVMPSIGGYELARRLESLVPDLPVLYISGYPREELARHGVPEGEISLLHKPFRPEELIGRVHHALETAGE